MYCASEPANKLSSADEKGIVSNEPTVLRLIDEMSHEIPFIF